MTFLPFNSSSCVLVVSAFRLRRATQQTQALRDLAERAELDALIALLAVLCVHAASYQRRWLGDS